MIVTEAEQAPVFTTGVGMTTEFEYTISAKAFKMLTADIYPNPVLAVIREISCNAHDAHLEAGNDDQFVVHLPTPLEPWFSVRDFGVGLSDEDMRKVYTNFFKSTKTDSNDFTGAFGLGSKSPFAIEGTTNFTVKSYYDGHVTIYSCYLNERGLPVITALTDPMPTNEPVGLEVQVDVLERDFVNFENDAVKVLKYFDPVPVINVPSVVDRITQAKEELHADDAFVGDGYAVRESYEDLVVIMGNVAYRYNASYGEIANKLSGYVTVDIGELEIDPGRTNILNNEANRQVMSRLFERISAEIGEKLCEEIDELPTAWDRYVRSNQLSRIANVFGIKLNKYYIKKNNCGRWTQYYERYGKCKQSVGDSVHDLLDAENYIKRPRFQARVKAYVRENSKRVNLLSIEQAIRLNLPQSALKNLDDIPKIEYNRGSGGGGSRGPKRTDMDVKICSRYGHSFSDATVPIESDEERVYVRTNRDSITAGGSWWTVQRASRLFGITVYGINNQTYNRPCFNKEDGGWITLNEYIKRELPDFEPDAIYTVDHDAKKILGKMDNFEEDLDLLDDEEFVELVRLSNKVTDNSDYTALCNYINVEPKEDLVIDLCDRLNAINAKYMLLDDYSCWGNPEGYHEHFIQYLNLTHGASSDN